MALTLDLATLCGIRATLLSMRPDEDRDFQIPGGTRRPIKVHCMGGAYRPEDVKFYIHGVGIDSHTHHTHAWRGLDATACGIYFALAD